MRILGDGAGRGRRQRPFPRAGRHGRLLPAAGREPHGTAADAVVHQLPAGRAAGCVGCHETREEAAAPAARSAAPWLREPSIPVPPPWGDRPMSFLRDIQPVLDRHCVGCHSGLKPAGGLDFSGGLTASGTTGPTTRSSPSKLVARSNVGEDARITMPLAFGSHKSKLVAVLRDGAVQQAGEAEPTRTGCGWSPGSTPTPRTTTASSTSGPSSRPTTCRPTPNWSRRSPPSTPGGARLPRAGRGLAARLDRPAPARAKPVPGGAAGESRRRNGPVQRKRLPRFAATPTTRPCCSWSPQRCARPGTRRAATSARWDWRIHRLAGRSRRVGRSPTTRCDLNRIAT